MGFCLYGNVAVAAADARDRHGLSRILIVDFDVHHGNGTQEIFYADGRVGLLLDPPLSVLSRHRRGRTRPAPGPGLGFTRNIPVRYGTRRPDYIAAFRAGLEAMADKVRPELVLVERGLRRPRRGPGRRPRPRDRGLRRA